MEMIPQAIVAPDYQTKVYRKKEQHQWARFERTHTWKKNDRLINVFGDCWALGWCEFTNDQVSVQTRRHRISLNGSCAVWFPPYSIIDWRFRGGTIFWQAIVSNKPLPQSLPQKACIFDRKANQVIPDSVEGIEQLFKEATFRDYIDKEESISSVAHRTKSYIDHHWREDCLIEDISNKLGYNQSVMDRSFKACFGLSPIQYRNKMRLLEAAHTMLIHEGKVTEIALDVGFSGVSNFTKQFKKTFKVPPSKYNHHDSVP
jgi:AraC-like DNA-binding protein